MAAVAGDGGGPRRRNAAAAAWRRAGAALSALWALGACTVSQQIHLRGGCSGETAIAIEFSDSDALVHDLTGRSEAGADALASFGNRVRSHLDTREDVTAVRVDSSEADRMEVEFAFRDARAVLPNAPLRPLILASEALAEVDFITFEEVAEGTRVRAYLDLNGYRQFSSLFPLLDNPLIRPLGPEESAGLTPEDYLAIVAFVLGPDGPAAISDSEIAIRIRVDGELVSQRGGRVEEDGAVVFEVPLLDVLLLHQPLEMEIVARFSGASCTAPAPTAGPAAPAGFTARGDSGSIILNWDDPADATVTGYEVRLRHPADGNWRAWRPIAASTTLTTGHTLPGLTAGARYRIQVRALNSAGAGQPGEADATP